MLGGREAGTRRPLITNGDKRPRPMTTRSALFRRACPSAIYPYLSLSVLIPSPPQVEDGVDLPHGQVDVPLAHSHRRLSLACGPPKL